MIALEFSQQNEEDAKERYGFTVSFAENNSVHIRDALGKEVAFEFPKGDVEFDQYDDFIRQMQDRDIPLPSVENVRMTVGKPLADISREIRATNSETQPYSWEQHAEDHGITVDELKAMYLFAREQLYARFRSRLRQQAD